MEFELGLDTWEGQLDINETQLQEHRVKFVMVRLSDINGQLHRDENFDRQWLELGQADIHKAPYHVYSPWYTGLQNYQWLLANMPADAKVVMLDIEVKKDGYAPATYAAEVAKFCAYCKAKWHVIIYTGEWFLSVLSSWPSDYDYCWAQYPNALYPAGDKVTTWDSIRSIVGTLQYPYNQAKVPGRLLMWQCSGDRLIPEGCLRSVDILVFYGNSVDLDNLFGYSYEPAPIVNDQVVDSRVLFEGATYSKWLARTSHGEITYHVIEIETARVAKFFVSPKQPDRDYVFEFMDNYGLDIAINGDGFVGVIPQGFTASEGTIWNVSSKEETIYISKENNLSVTKPMPIWNAISFPNRLLWAGALSASTETRLDVDPRTAFGWSQDQSKTVWLTVDGIETYDAYRTGMNFLEVALRLQSRDCYYAMMFDGGGSSYMGARTPSGIDTLNEPCGEDYIPQYDKKMRRVANVLGVKMKEASMGYTIEWFDKPQYWRLNNVTAWQTADQTDLDQDGLCFYPAIGSATAQLIRLEQPELDLIQQENTGIDEVTWERKLQWATKDVRGYPYFVQPPGVDIHLPPWLMCHLIIGSRINPTTDEDWNTVKVVGKSSNGFYMIEGIPPGSDLRQYNRLKYPYYWHRCNATNPLNMTTYDTNGAAGKFYYGLFAPVGRAHSAGDVVGTGMWIAPHALHSMIQEGGEPNTFPAVPFAVEILGIPKWYGMADLNIREGPTMFNNGKVGYFKPYSISKTKVSILEFISNTEGVFGRIADGLYVALYLQSSGKYYTSWRKP